MRNLYCQYGAVSLTLLGLFFISCRGGDYGVSSPGAFRLEDKEGVLLAFYRDRKVLSYRHEQGLFKPYVRELFSPQGVNVLLDAPSDHRHHHGLMFATQVDGVNFWEEQEQSGRQQHIEVRATGSRSQEPRSCGFFTTDLEWRKANKQEILLREQRTIRLLQVTDLPATVLTWDTLLQTPLDKRSVTLSGSHYNGLGLRFARSLDGQGPFINADGRSGKVFRGDERLVESRWCAYQAEAEGKPVTVAMFDHPDNPKAVTWFTMSQPFAYLSATLKYHEAPYILYSDEQLRLRYGVAVADGHLDAEAIEAHYQQWLAVGWGRTPRVFERN